MPNTLTIKPFLIKIYSKAIQNKYIYNHQNLAAEHMPFIISIQLENSLRIVKVVCAKSIYSTREYIIINTT